MTTLALLAPSYLGEERIGLKLSTETPAPTDGYPLLVDVDYAKAEPEGVMLPLVCTVTAPSGRRILDVTFTSTAPLSLEWTPEEGGRHLVRLSELFHNHWFGSLEVNVAGDEQVED